MSIKKNFGAVIKLKTISNFLGKGFFLALLSSQTQASDRLYEAIGERLSLMQEVAAYKFKNNLPIQSNERESKVIDMAIQAGLGQRITRDSLRKVFQTQIEAAREIQSCWFDKFSNMTSLPETSNLTQVIRPKIEALGKKIVKYIP
ncbi:MAG: gamma subclass chorismate mutase AroQ, partial [Pseudomonadota bacterium]|nr:gamma subclass chorismate mutase AroQ [Pseudomonadota bacterium]